MDISDLVSDIKEIRMGTKFCNYENAMSNVVLVRSTDE